MPLRYVIDKDRRLVVSTASADLTFDEVLAHQNGLLGDPAFEPTFNQLFDATALITTRLTADETRRLASRRIFSATSRRAFVAASPAIFGIGRLFETYLEIAGTGSETCIFYDLASALKWLGIDSTAGLPR